MHLLHEANMKKLFKALLFVGTAFILTACAGSESIGERAIIKTIFIDYTEESYEASLVVFTCEPSTDTMKYAGRKNVDGDDQWSLSDEHLPETFPVWEAR